MSALSQPSSFLSLPQEILDMILEYAIVPGCYVVPRNNTNASQQLLSGIALLTTSKDISTYTRNVLYAKAQFHLSGSDIHGLHSRYPSFLENVRHLALHKTITGPRIDVPHPSCHPLSRALFLLSGHATSLRTLEINFTELQHLNQAVLKAMSMINMVKVRDLITIACPSEEAIAAAGLQPVQILGGAAAKHADWVQLMGQILALVNSKSKGRVLVGGTGFEPD